MENKPRYFTIREIKNNIELEIEYKKIYGNNIDQMKNEEEVWLIPGSPFNFGLENSLKEH